MKEFKDVLKSLLEDVKYLGGPVALIITLLFGVATACVSPILLILWTIKHLFL